MRRNAGSTGPGLTRSAPRTPRGVNWRGKARTRALGASNDASFNKEELCSFASLYDAAAQSIVDMYARLITENDGGVGFTSRVVIQNRPEELRWRTRMIENELEEFHRGVTFSADGSTLCAYDASKRALTVGKLSNDSVEDVFEVKTGERSHQWMLDASGRTCTTSERDAPTTTRECDYGRVVATYRSFNDKDEVTGACGLGYVNDGRQIASGCDGFVDVFDVERPGRTPVARVRTRTKTSVYERLGSQGGVVSCVDGCPIERDVFACGTYGGGRGAIDCGVYDGRADGGRVASWASGGAGVTQTKWSACGNFVFVASRKNSKISCVDIRRTGSEVYTLERNVGETNQRVTFDIEPCGAHLVSGGVDGKLRFFDLRRGVEIMPCETEDGCPARWGVDTVTCVNSFAFHPFASAPGSRAFRGAFAVGERVFVDFDSSDSDHTESDAIEDPTSYFGVYLVDYPTESVPLDAPSTPV